MRIMIAGARIVELVALRSSSRNQSCQISVDSLTSILNCVGGSWPSYNSNPHDGPSADATAPVIRFLSARSVCRPAHHRTLHCLSKKACGACFSPLAVRRPASAHGDVGRVRTGPWAPFDIVPTRNAHVCVFQHPPTALADWRPVHASPEPTKSRIVRKVMNGICALHLAWE